MTAFIYLFIYLFTALNLRQYIINGYGFDKINYNIYKYMMCRNSTEEKMEMQDLKVT